LDADEKKNGQDSCCFVACVGKNNIENKICAAFLKKNVTKDYIKQTEDLTNFTDLSIKCNSKWLNFSMLFIGLFALLF
jgi:hypothetical protein